MVLASYWHWAISINTHIKYRKVTLLSYETQSEKHFGYLNNKILQKLFFQIKTFFIQ
jgi:hypothetical protein